VTYSSATHKTQCCVSTAKLLRERAAVLRHMYVACLDKVSGVYIQLKYPSGTTL